MLQVKDPLRDVQDEAAVLRCDKCLGEVYREEPVFAWDGKTICVDCFKEKVVQWLKNSPTQVADALGFQHSLGVSGK